MRNKTRKRVRRTRKQPRRLTPPLFLRGENSGREVVEVDQETITRELMLSSRTTAFLALAPGLRVRVGSRCINKRRVPVLYIGAKDYTPPPKETGAEIQAAREQMSTDETVRCPDHRNGGATRCPRGGPALQIWQRKQWGD